MEQQPPPMPGNPYPSPPPPAMMPPNYMPPAPQGYYTHPSGMPAHSGKTAFMFGAIFGLIAGVVFVVEGVLLTQVLPLGPNLFLNTLILWVLPLFIQWIFYLLAGLMASWRTGKTSTGVVASFWVNLGYLLGALVVFFLPRSFILRHYFVSNHVYTNLSLIFGAISLLLSIGSGAGFGALGGMMGKSQYHLKAGIAGRV